jgi:hypothetical protein
LKSAGLETSNNRLPQRTYIRNWQVKEGGGGDKLKLSICSAPPELLLALRLKFRDFCVAAQAVIDRMRWFCYYTIKGGSTTVL